MKVEKALRSDIDTLVQLRMAYLLEDRGHIDDQDAEMILQNLPAYFERHMEKDLFCYIVREESRIVSCAFLLVVEKPMSPAFLNGMTGTVLNVYTCPPYRRKGYARLLINELLCEAKRMNLCALELKATDAGYSVYRSAGFMDDVSKYRPMKWNLQQ
ncbi:MAG: GNAT family N-acetyltransferase [Clostridia bacterium]|nr:GNAT family N-acetyltransferase [Clostridia bacterium]